MTESAKIPSKSLPTSTENLHETDSGPADNLDVDGYLRVRDVRAVTRFDGELVKGTLQGIQTSKTYDSVRYRVVGDDTNYGIALQVWKLPSGARALDKYEEHRRTYPNVTTTEDVTRYTLRGQKNRIMHLCWLVEHSATLYTLTCDEQICSWEGLVILAKNITYNEDSQ